MTELTSRERVARTLARRDPDRVPIYDKFWAEVELDFRKRLNLPLKKRDHKPWYDWDLAPASQNPTLWEYFEMDLAEVAWPDYRLRFTAPEVLEETDEWILQRDGNWAELRWWKHQMGTPEHVGFGINCPERWAEVKHLLTPSRDRVRWDEFWPLYRRTRAENRFICYCTVEPFEMVKDVLGHEIMLISMIERPEWIHDVFNTYTETALRMFEIIEAEGMICDGAFVYGDMAYRNATLMSPAHYREFLQPYHKRMFDQLHARGMPVIFHSDGDIRAVIPDLIDAGVDAINPLEVKASMDLRELAPKHGDRLSFVGNIDVRILATNDEEAVREEVRTKLRAAMPYHGIVYHSDHSVPPGVTLETYRAVLDEVRTTGRYD